MKVDNSLKTIKQSTGLRIFIDFVLVLISFVFATFVWSVLQALRFSDQDLANLFTDGLANTLAGAIATAFLVNICGLVFQLYTRGRTYPIYHKMLIAIQSVGLAFLLVGVFMFMFPAVIQMSRTILLTAFIASASLITLARVMTGLVRFIADGHKSSGTVIKSIVTGSSTIVVIGGAGYVGSLLLPRLLKAGYKVRLLDLLMYGEEPIANVINHPNLEIIRGDYRQIDHLVSVLRGADSVIHLGGLVGDPACSVDEELTIDVNLTSTRVIAEVAKGHGVKRFIFASSCSVYGASDEELDENSRLNPVSLYAKSKIASEKVLLELASPDFQPVFLRFGTIFGISGRTRFDLVANLLVAKALFEGQITVFGADQWRPFVHVDDAAAAIMASLQAPLSVVGSQAYNIGSNGQNFTLGQIGEAVKNLVPDAELIIGEADGDRRNYKVRFDKAKRDLHFEAKWTIPEGMKQVAKEIREGRVTDYKLPLYSNVAYLKTAKDKIAKKIYEEGWEYHYLESSN